jgi:hypothetical protein
MIMGLLSDSKSMTGQDASSDNFAAKRVPGASPVMSLKLKVLIVAVLVGFGILHIIGGTIMQRASGQQPIDAIMLMHNED